jgi:hypothetical protein
MENVMKRTKHNLSNYKLATMDMGKLYPVQLQEVLPGDTMQLSSSALVRVSPMVAPVMHPCTVRIHHWFVPTRLLWDKWEDFITGGPGNDNVDVIPTLNDSVGAGQILDYMGVPPGTDGVNILPLFAYNLIWNEFYRDQDLQDEIALDSSGDIQNVSWRKDYFTTARPFSQKGADITIPIGTSAPVTGTTTSSTIFNSSTIGDDIVLSHGSTVNPPINVSHSEAGSVGDITAETSTTHDLVADLSSATGISAIEFRELFALQRYAEARAQYGSRYSEYLRYLGVKPSDARLQRPEYLGGGKSTLQFSEVLQTASDIESATPVGTMRGHGITAMKTKRSRRFFEEHGYVISLMSVVPKSIYESGAQRLFWKQDKEDFYQKELQSVGQQEVKMGEIYANATDPHATFGYSDRYAEYQNTPSTVAGEFRDTLDYWHLARTWSTTPPSLNADFIKCDPSKRIFADQTNDTLWCMINNNVIARRMVNKTSGTGRLM